jgi:hypothetical protein
MEDPLFARDEDKSAMGCEAVVIEAVSELERTPFVIQTAKVARVIWRGVLRALQEPILELCPSAGLYIVCSMAFIGVQKHSPVHLLFGQFFCC